MRLGESRGIEIGQEQVIKAMILDNLESGVSKEVIIGKLQRFLQIDEKKAEQYYEENAVKITV